MYVTIAGGERMDRKSIVNALSEYFGTKSKYLGAPTFGYVVKSDGEVYTVDREGVIYRNGIETTLEAVICPVSEEVAQVNVIDSIEIKLPLEGHTGATLQNLINMLTSRQHLLMKALELKEPIIDDQVAEELSKTQVDSIEDFKSAYENALNNRHANLVFEFEKGTMTITFLSEQFKEDEIRAITVLVSSINEFSKKQKRASYKKVQDDNPKFAFRTWITRIGMKGNEYKEARKVLLSNLEGNGAYRKSTKERG